MTSIVSVCALPPPRPIPSNVASMIDAPAWTAARLFALASSRLLCPWNPIRASRPAASTSIYADTWFGSIPPALSTTVTVLAPRSTMGKARCSRSNGCAAHDLLHLVARPLEIDGVAAVANGAFKNLNQLSTLNSQVSSLACQPSNLTNPHSTLSAQPDLVEPCALCLELLRLET